MSLKELKKEREKLKKWYLITFPLIFLVVIFLNKFLIWWDSITQDPYMPVGFFALVMIILNVIIFPMALVWLWWLRCFIVKRYT